jgi:hypothetical protein
MLVNKTDAQAYEGRAKTIKANQNAPERVSAVQNCPF